MGWILLNGVTAMSNLSKLPLAAASLYEQAATWYHTDQTWTGKWTNVGSVDARDQPEFYVDLDLLVYDNNVSGTVTSGPLQDFMPLESVLIEGSVNDDTLDVLAYDHIQGIPKRIATFKITRLGPKSENLIKVITTWQAIPFFTKETILWRAGETEMLPKQEKAVN